MSPPGFPQLIRSNLPKDDSVDEKFVVEFHSALDSLEKATEYDLSSFRIPDSELRPKFVMGFSSSAGSSSVYSDNRFCDKYLLAMKVDGVLATVFGGKADEPSKDMIGFAAPKDHR